MKIKLMFAYLACFPISGIVMYILQDIYTRFILPAAEKAEEASGMAGDATLNMIGRMIFIYAMPIIILILASVWYIMETQKEGYNVDPSKIFPALIGMIVMEFALVVILLFVLGPTEYILGAMQDLSDAIPGELVGFDDKLMTMIRFNITMLFFYPPIWLLSAVQDNTIRRFNLEMMP